MLTSNSHSAEQLTSYAINNAIRICWWSGEEFGLLGSEYYTSTLTPEEAAKIRLYLNFDMIASPVRHSPYPLPFPC